MRRQKPGKKRDLFFLCEIKVYAKKAKFIREQ